MLAQVTSINLLNSQDFFFIYIYIYLLFFYFYRDLQLRSHTLKTHELSPRRE